MHQTNRATITLPSDTEILITRTFMAPRELVFKILTSPELVPQWWGPRNTTTIVDHMDPRPGGTYRFVQQTAQGEIAFRGEFREILPPERVVQTSEFEQMPGPIVVDTMTLTEQDGQTVLTVLETCPSREVRDAILASGMESGMNESYDRLEEILARQVRQG